MKDFHKYLKETIGGNDSGKIGEEMSISLENVREIYDQWNKLAGDLTFKGRHDEDYLMDLSLGLEELKEQTLQFLSSVEKAQEYIYDLPMGQ
jgi:hypothetical protein